MTYISEVEAWGFIKQTAYTMVRDARSLGLITADPLKFISLFCVTRTNREVCSGGYTNDRPSIHMSVSVRYRDKESWLFRHRGRTSRSRTWTEVIRHANQNEWYHPEYDRFRQDPDIGAFISDDPYDHILCSTAHEIAHAIQYWNYCRSPCHIVNRPKPHGKEFQDIYRALRVEVVNPLIYGELDALAADTTE